MLIKAEQLRFVKHHGYSWALPESRGEGSLHRKMKVSADRKIFDAEYILHRRTGSFQTRFFCSLSIH